MPQEQSQKIIALSENLIRYSCLQAQQGLYLNAVLILRQASQDIHKRIQQGCLSFQSAEPILKKLQLKQQQYISISKFASPRKFNYDQAPTEPKLLSSSSETTIEDTRIEDSPPKQAASPHKHQ